MKNLGKKLSLIFAIFGLLLVFASCNPAEVIRIELDEQVYNLEAGTSIKVQAAITKGNNPYETELGFRSEDETVATFVNGEIQAIREGETTIRVYAIEQPLAYITAKVTVKFTKSLQGDFSVKQNLTVGETTVVTYRLASDSTDSIVTFTSSDENILSVDAEGNVCAKALGEAQIVVRVTYPLDTNQYREYTLHVEVVKTVYSIEYILDGGVCENLPTEYTEGMEFALPVPTKEGYTFVGWYRGEEKVESITAETTGNLTLVAKYKANAYALEFILDGGVCENLPTTYETGTTFELPVPTKNGYTFVGWYMNEEKMEMITPDMKGNLTLTAKWEAIEYTITYDLDGGVCENLLTVYTKGTSFALPTPTKEGYTFLGWYMNDTKVESITEEMTGDITLTTKWEKIVIKSQLEFILDGGVCENLPTEYTEGQALLLPQPIKEGYTFLGWYMNDTKVESITEEMTGNLTLTAKWESKGPKELLVDPTNANAYATVEAALDNANDGDTIVIVAGTFDGIKVTKSVTIRGANCGVNPVKQVRTAETIFTGDILVCADNVTLDGMQLTGSARIVANPDASVDHLTIINVLVDGSTIDGSTNAPLYFIPNVDTVVYSNTYIANMMMKARSGRAMIMYATQLDGITIENCEFHGTSSSGQYNDGLKFNANTKLKFDIMGDVQILSNTFVDFKQYPVWFGTYAEGTYSLQNNIFEDSGVYANYNNGCFTFATYASVDGTNQVKIDVLYNTTKQSGILARIQAAGLDENSLVAHVNYNKIYGCLNTKFVSDNGKNSGNYIDASNNYYDKTPTAAHFSGVSVWEPYYTSDAEVPVYGEPVQTNAIEYVLGGGTLPNGAPTSYNSSTGLASLPVPTMEGMIFLGWYLNGELVESILAGTEGDIVLVARYREDALYVGNGTEDWIYPTLAEALAHAKEGDKIILLAGEYNENVTISIANLTIVGPNAGINPNKDTRKEEAIYKGVIKVDATATNLTIDGLAFTEGGSIKNAQDKAYSGFTFVNNKVYDTIDATTTWGLNRYVADGFIEFKMASGGTTSNFSFKNNLFENVQATNILLNRAINAAFDGNVFKDFGRDAIRFEGGYNYGVFSFTNNLFEQTVSGNGYNGIFFYAIAGAAGTKTEAIIKNNVFKNLGTNDTTAEKFNGAIACNIYQENKTNWIIENNVFDHCKNYMYLRNNGASASIWSCTVQNNQFLGLPETHYFGTYRGSDTSTTNPHLAIFGENYYEDNAGNVITDLTPYATYFQHLSTYGTTLSTKPGLAIVEPLEFYTISYELGGGTVKGSLVNGYTNMMDKAITLPTLAKENYQFLGWLLNDEYVTEIPVTSRGNLNLVASWKQLEGEIYEVTYVFNGGYSEELLIANRGDGPSLTINNYNYNNGTFWGGKYTTDIFIGTSSYDPAATFSDRIYIGKNAETGLYEIVKVVSSGASSWPEGAEYLITISNSYNNYWGSINPVTQKLKVGQMVAFSKPIEDITADEPGTVCFFDAVPKGDELTVSARYSDALIQPGYLGYKFLGWFDENDTYYPNLEALKGDVILYAKWEQLNPVTGIKVDAICDELLTGETFQIEASVEPSDAYFKQLFYESSNTDILTVSSTGLITAINAGKATVTIYDYVRKISTQKEITIYPIQSVNVDFDRNYGGAIQPGETLQLVAQAFGKGMENATLTYTSSDTNILTVSETGLITAIAEGEAYVMVAVENTNINISIRITVKTYLEDTEIDRLVALLAKNNFAVVETGNVSLYNDGVERVYVSTYGSVNKYLFDAFKVDETYYATSEANPNNHKSRRDVDTIEFVTVHDTATLTGTVVSIAQGMSSGETSIHYTVGNDAIYGVVPEKYIAYHAGDGTTATFTWTKTNVATTMNVAPVFGIVQNGSAYYLTLNGTATQIEVPTVNGAAPSVKDLSHLGPTWKVENGYYYIGGPLWYSSSYRTIGSRGGNNNSIGIEMCSNLSGDIYDTWQRTAQLVADILIRNQLDPTRVKMHNTWTGKNCPQTIIAGDYWSNFMEMVELQYEIQKNYSAAKITMKSNNPEIVDNTGRVICAPTTTTTVSYEVTVELGGETRAITLSSIIPGTTTWEQWNGTYSASKIWNNGVFAR
ncbi:MAG: InlB B-repeat-containing protein [Prevotella sp.]|nr:InlB B-repeat-containing protein [Staphylococcus sp.]MCM1350922.1 InlB B-repeat-containing protein [Prevotella sp.]